MGLNALAAVANFGRWIIDGNGVNGLVGAGNIFAIAVLALVNNDLFRKE